jgi:hypothetical protein
VKWFSFGVGYVKMEAVTYILMSFPLQWIGQVRALLHFVVCPKINHVFDVSFF